MNGQQLTRALRAWLRDKCPLVTRKHMLARLGDQTVRHAEKIATLRERHFQEMKASMEMKAEFAKQVDYQLRKLMHLEVTHDLTRNKIRINLELPAGTLMKTSNQWSHGQQMDFLATRLGNVVKMAVMNGDYKLDT